MNIGIFILIFLLFFYLNIFENKMEVNGMLPPHDSLFFCF